MLWFILALFCAFPLNGRGYVDEPIVYGTFPKDFMWAAATSAYQIEGGWDADGKGLSIWDVYVTDSSLIADGSTGQTACDSYHLYERDVEMLSALKVTHYRFSISWPRLLPNGVGTVNQKGIDYYKRLIAALLNANIQPIVTLYHWDLPQALQAMGGWMNPNSSEWFTEFARLCFNEFGNQVKWWITINEPWVVAYLNYGTGGGAPGLVGPGTNTYLVGHHLILAHAAVYHMYKNEFYSTQLGKVGITLNIGWSDPKDESTRNRDAAERSMVFSAGWFADPIFTSTGDYPSLMKLKIADKSARQGFNHSRLPQFTATQKQLVANSADFMGINHYSSTLVEDFSSDIENVDYYADQDIQGSNDPTWYSSSTDWLKVTPFGMNKLLQWVANRYDNPEVMITENGISDMSGSLDDLHRVYYYKHYLNSMLKAVQSGVKVIGYAAWSLMDNYEWNAGYTQKFGIFSVNFTSPQLTRTAKASALYLAGIYAANGFVDDGQTCGLN